MPAAKRVLRYLKGTLDQMIVVCLGKNGQLTAFPNANLAANYEKNRKSRSGIMIIFGETIMNATSILQKSISISSTEAKYVALSDSVKTISWLRQLLVELGVKKNSGTFYQESSRAIEWPTPGNLEHFPQCKGINVKQTTS